MGEPIKCQLCAKTASVHLTQIVNNKIHKIDLCEDCAQSKGVTDPEGFSLSDILGTPVPEKPKEEEPEDGFVCEHCGISQTNFKQQGRLGCPSCYRSFSGLIGPMLENMHKGVVHVGKVPHHAIHRIERGTRLAQLQTDLDLAIADERYEDAANYRDKIKELSENAEGIEAT